jgi:peptide chain release factor 2
MDDLNKYTEQLTLQVNDLQSKLKIAELINELDALRIKSQAKDFWHDSDNAQGVMKHISKLEVRIKPWQELDASLSDIAEMLKLEDDSLKTELELQLKTIGAEIDKLKETLKFNGTYDDRDVVMSIYAGAGGTDAQDWTQMLFRMYTRFFEKNGWKARVVEESLGEEAGLKSITLEIEGDYVYAKLKGEHGVHRLVRLSPFNSDNLRQTSFSKVDVMPKIDRPDELSIDDKELKVDVYRSGGHGGQSVNTTDSAVRITHVPTGISVAIQNERSQLQNRETAMTILRSRLAQLQLEQHAEALSALKGPNQSAEWGNQIRSYVLHPYKQVKDLRTRHESSDPDGVLDGDLEPFIDAYLEYSVGIPEDS